MTVAHANQLFRVRYRQVLQQGGMNQCKDRGVGADSQTQRQQSSDSESGVLTQLPCCVANVSNQRIQKRQPPLRPILFPRLCHTTEGTERCRACFLFRHATLPVLLGCKVDMRQEFLVQVRVELPRVDQRDATAQQNPYPIHRALLSWMGPESVPLSWQPAPSSRFRF